MKYKVFNRGTYLLMPLLFITACTKYEEVEAENIPNPVYEISRERLNNLDNITVLELLVLLKYQVPIPEMGMEFAQVLRRLKESEAKIYDKQDSLIIAEIFKPHKTTRKMISIMLLEYHFENKLLVKGPVIVK